MTVDTFCVIPLSVCNATQCIILYKVIICATCVTIHTFCYTNVCGLYNVYIICTHPALRSIYTQCVISHTLCNLCVFFLFLHKPSVLLHSVCSFTHFFVAWPNKSRFSLFCREIRFYNLRVFRCKLYSPKILPV